MNEFEKQLEIELLEQGASGEELLGLVEFKNRITKFSDVRRSEAFKKSFLQKLEQKENHGQFFVPGRLFTPSFLIALLMFILITGIISAQNSLPGQTLYPVKILSENIIKTVNPSFKDEILKRRSQEIKTLTQEKKNSGQLNNTINKYEKDLEENKTVDPIKIEQSRKNLEDARDNSEDEDKKGIEHVIIQTENKINESHRDENENRSEDVKGVRSKRGSDQNEEDKDQDKSQDESHDDNNDEDKKD